MSDIDLRLPAIKSADFILATLQSAFSQDDLVDGTNPYRYIPNQPQNSKVWVCAKPQRIDTRDGNRMIVTVSRGDYLPQDLHLYNNAGGNFGDIRNQSDLASTTIYIECEAGNDTASEVLASVCYEVIKKFRLEIMAEFDVHSLRPMAISPPQERPGVPGKVWVTTVTVKVDVQEFGKMTEVANRLNAMTIREAASQLRQQRILQLDTSS